MTTKKRTVLKRLTEGDYIRALWLLENQEEYKKGLMIDLSDIELKLSQAKKSRRFYITELEKELLDDFCNRVAKSKSNFEETMLKLGITEYKTYKYQ